MDEKYILELGKILQSIDNLVKVQDKHHSEFRELLNSQRNKTDSELKELKQEIKEEKKKCEIETKEVKLKIEKLEKFDIKVVAYASISATIVTLTLRYLPTFLHTPT